MWYALLDMHNSEDCLLWLEYGTLQDIADAVLEQCEFCVSDTRGIINADELISSGYTLEAEHYFALKDAHSASVDLLNDFKFALADNEISVYGLTDNYSEFKHAFESHGGRKHWFIKKLKLPDEVSPQDEPEFAKELSSILFEPEEFLWCPSFTTRFIPKIPEDEM